MDLERRNAMALDITDEWDDDYDEWDWCEMGEHEFEPVMHLLDGVIEVMVYECRWCGAIDA